MATNTTNITHNLLISNDKADEYVKFDVLLPDGYNSFKIDYLNGTMINQNFLNVGDKIKFSFNNNPIRYDNINLKANFITTNYNTGRTDNKDYKYLTLDLFKYYKLCFIPVYCFYYENQYYYLFNPCRNNQILAEPIKNIPPIQITDFRGTRQYDNVFASFSGQFILCFKPVNNIDDITVTIGESISNSKTRPQDMGSYTIQAENINNIKSQSIQSTAYNYGSAWTYPVNNLIMKSLESFNIKLNENETIFKKLIFVNKTTNTTSLTSLSAVNVINGVYKDYQFYIYTLDDPYITELTQSIILNNEIQTPLSYPICKKYTNENKYNSITYDDGEGELIINNGGFTNNNYYGINTTTGDTININNQHFISTDFNYSTNYILILVEVNDGTEEEPEWTDSGYNFNDMPIRFREEDFNTKARKIEFGEDNIYNLYYTDLTEEPAVDYEISVRFRLYDENSQEFKANEDINFWMIGYIKSFGNSQDGTDQQFKIITSYNSGLLSEQNKRYNVIHLDYFNKPFQLTSSIIYDGGSHTYNEADRLLNPEDIYINAVNDGRNDGLNLSLRTFDKNIIHELTYSDTRDITIKNYEQKWFWNPDFSEHANDRPLKAFIPLKTHRMMTIFRNKIFQTGNGNFQKGFFVITDLNGDFPESLTDSDSEYFLSTGHETLNVESPKPDDGLFKTFNGSLMFDRSDSRITRLYSNDITGAALGYINDILSAKLSRYYYISNLDIFNSFIDTNNKLIINTNPRAVDNYYNMKDRFYTGSHSITYASCYDIITLIGSENVVNNCLSSLQVEQQIYPNCLIWGYRKLMNEENKELLKTENKKDFIYKFFHFYNSGLNEEPHNGYGANDSENTTIGGFNFISCNKDILSCDDNFNYQRKNTYKNTIKPFIINNGNSAYDNYDNIISDIPKNYNYNTNRNNKYGVIETLPAFRLYKNMNFEQTDLTITTGGVKTLHPIYLQSTPKILINNLLYMFDYVINQLLNTYNAINEDSLYNYISILTFKGYEFRTLDNNYYPIFRFGKTQRRISGRNKKLALSLDSLLILNYINGNSLNEFEDNEAIKSDIENEEIIKDISTDSTYTNIQLFSSRYFNFRNNINIFNMVCMASQYIESIIYNDSIFSMYYNIDNLENATELATNINNIVNSYINNVSSFNNIKICKILIVKLGEFLQYPKILYGVSSSFNSATNVSIDNLNMAKYKSEIEYSYKYNNNPDTLQQSTDITTKINIRPEQKINVYLGGVVFRYHQLALGYQNLNNELTDEIKINRGGALNKHFEIYVLDEYARRIPNKDTSQGFNNNLYLELTLFN